MSPTSQKRVVQPIYSSRSLPTPGAINTYIGSLLQQGSPVDSDYTGSFICRQKYLKDNRTHLLPKNLPLLGTPAWVIEVTWFSSAVFAIVAFSNFQSPKLSAFSSAGSVERSNLSLSISTGSIEHPILFLSKSTSAGYMPSSKYVILASERFYRCPASECILLDRLITTVLTLLGIRIR